jgi:hypothetical protein
METAPRHIIEAGRYIGFHHDPISHRYPLAFVGISL